MPTTFQCRPARAADVTRLREIERAAGELFRDLGMLAVADDEPMCEHGLLRLVNAGRAWVVADGDDRPVAYLAADVVDGAAHVEQVSVHPDAARQGLGGLLLDVVADWARSRGLDRLTLTTYADVPWNAPYYERCGFSRLPDGELTPGLAAIRRQEAERDLDAWPRVCMVRHLPT